MFYRPNSPNLMVLPVALVLLVLGGLLLLAMGACALTTQFQPEPTATNVPPLDVVVVPQEVVVTPTISEAEIALTLTAMVPLPTQTPYIITQPVVEFQPPAIVIPTGCQVRTDWPAYIVQVGDTVGALAIATNTSLADLVIGNCLQNPDLIQAGQTLYLPRTPVPQPPVGLPPAVTQVANSHAPVIGFVLVEPAVVDEARYLVAPGTHTVRAQGVGNAIRVSFFMSQVGTTAGPSLLGVDNNMADGAAIPWLVDANPFAVNVWAVATSPMNVEAATDPILVVSNG